MFFDMSIFYVTGNHKVLPTKTLPPIKNEREIGDDELMELALTFCSPKILSDMIDTNWKIRLASVQEFFQVCVIFYYILN